MIAYVEGHLAEMAASTVVVVTTGGVGYEIFLPAHTLSHLPERGSAVAFYTAFIVREDAQELFGFETWDERQMFMLLISLNKVGARTASAILSTFRPDDLRRVVYDDDPTPLTRVSGIGKKSAQQIFLELKYKLKVESCPALAAQPGNETKLGGVLHDTVAGLTGLGYSDSEALPVVRKVLHAEPDLDVSGALRAALRQLARAGKGDE